MVGLGPRKQRSRRGLSSRSHSLVGTIFLSLPLIGSMTDVPDDLLDQIKKLEKLFTVDQAKLKEVTNHFVKELEKGSSSRPSLLHEY